jgi:hypothetical protein
MGKRIGKIRSVRVGLGGYQEAQFGVWFDLGSDKQSWGVGDGRGAWSTSIECSHRCNWTEEDRDKQFAVVMRYMDELIQKARVNSVSDLVGIPVEVEFNGMTLKDWRVLEEAL